MKPTLSEIKQLQCRIDELETWISETAKELACTCDETYTDRGRHGPECRAYLLSDCPVAVSGKVRRLAKQQPCGCVVCTCEDAARAKWNAEADEYNPWDSLGQDEKDELIANKKNEQ